MNLSACIITLNEESNLPRCLESLGDLAEEIVIVDAGSTDRTKFIATDYNARLLRREWSGFVDQKNYAFSKASHDWILSLDADEALSPELASSIRNLKASPPSEAGAGFELCRVTFFQDRWIRFGDWYPDFLIRLFRKSRGTATGGSVHERIEVEGEIRRLSGDLAHYSFRNEADNRQRMKTYAALWAEDQPKNGTSVNVLNIGSHAFWRGFRSYLLKGGWRGGSLGWKLARLQAQETAEKYRALKTRREATQSPQ